MPNRTIYVKDEQLWEKAKKFAGKGGLSEVIADALQRFVADSEARAAGHETLRFVIQWRDRDPERIAFHGRELRSEEMGDESLSIYETKGGNFILIATEDDPGSHHPGHYYYATFKTLKEVGEDPELIRFWENEPAAARQWLEEEVAVPYAQSASKETWIE